MEIFPGLAAEACPEPGCVCEGRPEEHEPTGGWSAPTACAAGVCASLGSDPETHDKGCAMVLSRSALQSAGWMMPSENLYDIPQLQIKRGGIKFPRFRAETAIVSRRRWFRRTTWTLHVRYRSGANPDHMKIVFRNEQEARDAESGIKTMMQSINDDYNAEKSRK